MKLNKILVISVISFFSATAFGQVKSPCDSAVLKVQVSHTTSNQKDGEIAFKSAQSSDWRVFLVGGSSDFEAITDSRESILRNLPKGHYDAVFYDKNKKYCPKHFKILIQ